MLGVWLLVLCLAAAVVFGLARLRVDTTLQSFLPANDLTVSAINTNARTFGGDPIVALVESAQPRQLLLGSGQFQDLLKLEGKLSQLPNVAVVYGPATVMNQIAISAQDLIARISGARDALRQQAEDAARAKNLSASAVTSAGDAAVAPFDQRYGSLLVKGLPAGLPTTSNPSFISNVIYDSNGQPRAQWHFVVPNANSVAILVRPREDLDEADTEALVSSVRAETTAAGLKTSRITVTGVPAVTAELTQEAESELPLLAGIAALALLLRFLFAPASASRLRRLWPLLASVAGSAVTLAAFGWLGITMSIGAIGLFPLLLGIGSSFPLYLANFHNTRRVIVVSVASAASVASLVVSPLPFVRELGVALAVGVLLTVAATVLLGRLFAPPAGSASAEVSAPPRSRLGPVPRWLVLACLVAVGGLGWATLPRLDIQANPENLAQGLPGLADAQYAEGVLGSSGQISIVLTGVDTQGQQAMHWLDQAENAELSRFGAQLQPILTGPDLLSFLGVSPTPDQIASGVQLMPGYLTGAVFSPDGRQAQMIFGLKFQDLGAQTALLNQVSAALPKPPPGFTASVVGLPVAADRAYQLVSDDRYLSNGLGILAAGLVLVLGLRRRSDGVRAALAAALATGWTLALLWALGQSLNPLTAALGSLIAVTGCEFTVLLADAHRSNMSVLRRTVAWAGATSIIGYLSLVPSQIELLREFGVELAATVLLAYLAAFAVVRLLPVRDRARRPAPSARPPDDRPRIDSSEPEHAEVST